MSRIGNKPITVPDGVEVTLNENVITVKSDVVLKAEDGEFKVTVIG